MQCYSNLYDSVLNLLKKYFVPTNEDRMVGFLLLCEEGHKVLKRHNMTINVDFIKKKHLFRHRLVCVHGVKKRRTKTV